MAKNQKGDEQIGSFTVTEESIDNGDVTIKRYTYNGITMQKKTIVLALSNLIIAIVALGTFFIPDYVYTKDMNVLFCNIELLLMTSTVCYLFYNSFKKMDKKKNIVLASWVGLSCIYILNIIDKFFNFQETNYLSMFLGISIITLSCFYFIAFNKK